MIRCDKTLSELWHLRGSDNEEASDTAFMAISTIKKLLEENARLNNALEEIDGIIDGRLYTPFIERLSNAVLRGKGKKE